jgi:hypothetical protein
MPDSALIEITREHLLAAAWTDVELGLRERPILLAGATATTDERQHGDEDNRYREWVARPENRDRENADQRDDGDDHLAIGHDARIFETLA